MIKIKREYTRPSIDIPWHGEVLPDAEFMAKLQTYIDSGKHILFNISKPWEFRLISLILSEII